MQPLSTELASSTSSMTALLCTPWCRGESKRIWGRAEPTGCCQTHLLRQHLHKLSKPPLQETPNYTAIPRCLLITLRVTSTSNTQFVNLAGLGLGLYPICQQPPKWDAPNPVINSWTTPNRGSLLSRTSQCARVALGSITKLNLPAGLPKGDPMGHLKDNLGGSLRGPSIAGCTGGHRAVGDLEQPHAEAHEFALLHQGELKT